MSLIFRIFLSENFVSYLFLFLKGCSGFFKRSIHKNREYVCKATSELRGKCPIDKTHRNQCRACRLQKCFQVNMNKDGNQFFNYLGFCQVQKIAILLIS